MITWQSGYRELPETASLRGQSRNRSFPRSVQAEQQISGTIAMLHERLQRPSTRVEAVHVEAGRPSLVMKIKGQASNL